MQYTGEPHNTAWALYTSSRPRHSEASRATGLRRVHAIVVDPAACALNRTLLHGHPGGPQASANASANAPYAEHMGKHPCPQECIVLADRAEELRVYQLPGGIPSRRPPPRCRAPPPRLAHTTVIECTPAKWGRPNSVGSPHIFRRRPGHPQLQYGGRTMNNAW